MLEPGLRRRAPRPQHRAPARLYGRYSGIYDVEMSDGTRRRGVKTLNGSFLTRMGRQGGPGQSQRARVAEHAAARAAGCHQRREEVPSLVLALAEANGRNGLTTE
jgi:hypothetical protein